MDVVPGLGFRVSGFGFRVQGHPGGGVEEVSTRAGCFRARTCRSVWCSTNCGVRGVLSGAVTGG
jgi:hypothetical protein